MRDLRAMPFESLQWCEPFGWPQVMATEEPTRFILAVDPTNDAIDDLTLASVLDNIVAADPRHIFQVEASKPGRIGRILLDYSLEPIPNLWLGVRVTHPDEAGLLLGELARTPAAVRYVNLAPNRGVPDLREHLLDLDLYPGVLEGERGPAFRRYLRAARQRLGKLDWVCMSGDVGKEAQPIHPSWVQRVAAQCARTATPFLFAWWGSWRPLCGVHALPEAIVHEIQPDTQLVAIEESGVVHALTVLATRRGATAVQGPIVPPTAWWMKRGPAGRRDLDGTTFDGFPFDPLEVVPPLPGAVEFEPGRWTCPRCSKGDALCCELAQNVCGQCGGDGGPSCGTCQGAHAYWTCSCDAAGQHADEAAP